MTLLGTFLCCAQYGPTERLACPRLVSGGGGNGTLLSGSLDPIKA